MYICSGSQRPFKERSITIPSAEKTMGFWLPMSTFNNSVFLLGDLPPQKKMHPDLRPVVFMISTSRCRCRFFSLWSTGGLHWCRLTRSCHTFGQQEGQSIATYQRRTGCWRQLEVLGFETWPEYGRSKMCIIDINYYNFSICYSFVAWKYWGFTISQFRSCFLPDA